MEQTTILHSPTLESVLMVERTIEKYSQECGKYQLWKKLPKKMMYQTFQVILDYLEDSGKIMIDNDGCIIWTYNPKKIKKQLWPKEYIKQYGITNLWKYDLPNAWRLIYTIESDEVKIMGIVLEWFTHKEYEKRFNY